MHLFLKTPIQSCKAAIANKRTKKNKTIKADISSFIEESKVSTNARIPGIEEIDLKGLKIRMARRAFNEKVKTA